MNKKIDIAIVGCGGIGNFHLDNLLKYEDVNIVALASTNKQQLALTLKKAPNAKGYSSAKEMIEKEKIDCLFVCVTPHKHFNIETLAADKKINLYIEKPICLDYEQGEKTAKVIEKSGIICAVGYHERYNPVLNQLKNYIKQTNPLLAIGKWIDFLPPPLWWRDMKKSGGQIVEQTTHIFDMLRYIFGEGKIISGVTQSGLNKNIEKYNTQDCSVVTIKFFCGLLATITSACYLKDNAKPDIGFEIICPQISIKYDWGKSISYISKDSTQRVEFCDDFHYVAVDHFLKAVKENDKNLIKSDYNDALKTLKLTLDAQKAINGC